MACNYGIFSILVLDSSCNKMVTLIWMKSQILHQGICGAYVTFIFVGFTWLVSSMNFCHFWFFIAFTTIWIIFRPIWMSHPEISIHNLGTRSFLICLLDFILYMCPASTWKQDWVPFVHGHFGFTDEPVCLLMIYRLCSSCAMVYYSWKWRYISVQYSIPSFLRIIYLGMKSLCTVW
jgi:hypothetical protein